MAMSEAARMPYGPPTGVIEIINRYREYGMQKPFTIDVLVRAGITENLAPRVLSSLKALGLLKEDGNPTEQFDILARSRDDEFQDRFREIVAEAYAQVFSFIDPSQHGYDRIRDAFRGFEPRGQQERMVTLFLGLCEFAGFDISAARTPREGSARQPRGAMGSRTTRTAGETNGRAPGRGQTRRKGGQADDIATSGLAAPLVGLLTELKSIGPAWTEDRRNAWLSTFRAVLDYSYPAQKQQPPTAPDQGDYNDQGGQI